MCTGYPTRGFFLVPRLTQIPSISSNNHYVLVNLFPLQRKNYITHSCLISPAVFIIFNYCLFLFFFLPKHVKPPLNLLKPVLERRGRRACIMERNFPRGGANLGRKGGGGRINYTGGLTFFIFQGLPPSFIPEGSI